MEIPEIKSGLSIGVVLQHYGLRVYGNYRICCPFHPDRTPSMQIYPKTNAAYGFSSNCKTHGKSMDVIDFIMLKENITKHEAIVKAGTLLRTSPKPEKKTLPVKKEKAARNRCYPKKDNKRCFLYYNSPKYYLKHEIRGYSKKNYI